MIEISHAAGQPVRAEVHDLHGTRVGRIEESKTGSLRVVLDAPWTDVANAINSNISTGGRLSTRHHKLTTITGCTAEEVNSASHSIRILSERRLRITVLGEVS